MSAEDKLMWLLAAVLGSAIGGLISFFLGYSVGRRANGYGYNAKKVPDWRGFLENRFSRWLDKHTQEIIDEAALLMAAKGSRKKAWREVLAEVKADEGKQQE